METCKACGAALSPDIDWCPQCYLPKRGGPARQPGGPMTGVRVAPGGVPAGPATPGPVTPGPAIPGHPGFVPRPEAHEPVQYSRWRAGPTSFGPLGRSLLSIGVVVLGVLGYFALLGNIGITPSVTSELLYALGYTPIAVWLWFRIWRPQRVQ